MKKRTPVVENRVIGKTSGCGYSKDGDGKYAVSDSVRRSMDDAVIQEMGVNALLDNVHKFAQQRLSEICKEKNRWWAEIREDLSLDKDTAMQYRDGIIKIIPKNPLPDPPEEDE